MPCLNALYQIANNMAAMSKLWTVWLKIELEKWALVDGNECRVWGQVIQALGDTADANCEFQVKYDDEKDVLTEILYEDFSNDDLVIIN